MYKLQRDVSSLADASRSTNLKQKLSKCIVMRSEERIPNVSISDYHKMVYKHFGIYVNVTCEIHHYVDITVTHTGSLMSSLLRSTIYRSVKFLVSLCVSHVRPQVEHGCFRRNL